MHMRYVDSVDEVKLNQESTGYTMVFPVDGTYSQMQSNMAATLNIDWMLDLAIDVLKFQGIQKNRSDLLKDLDQHILDASPAEFLYHPYISQAGERGPFINANARASFIGLSSNTAISICCEVSMKDSLSQQGTVTRLRGSTR